MTTLLRMEVGQSGILEDLTTLRTLDTLQIHQEAIREQNVTLSHAGNDITIPWLRQHYW